MAVKVACWSRFFPGGMHKASYVFFSVGGGKKILDQSNKFGKDGSTA